MVEEDVVQIVYAADTPLLGEFSELVSVYENLLVLLTPEISAKAVFYTQDSYINYVSFDPIIQLPPTLIKDVHV